MSKKPPGRQARGAPERGAGPGHTTPPRYDPAEPIEKVAPWRGWKALTLHASIGDAYPVHFEVEGLEDAQNARYSKLITSAAHKYFKIEQPPRAGEGPAAFLVDGEALRVVYDELIVQFDPLVSSARCTAIVEEAGFRVVEQSGFVESEWIVRHAQPGIAGKSLLEAADAFKPYEEVRFAWPNSVAEYQRAEDPPPPIARRWWLDKIYVNDATGNRQLAKGNSSVVIAVLDDGIDIAHPNLVGRVAAGLGRDFALLVTEGGHTDPRPKVQAASNPDSDYHGTLCAGVICSDGSATSYLGAAPGCKLIAVRVIDGPALISERRLANAIRYATGVADVISCSWTGPEYAGVVAAINDTIQGRGTKGSVLVGAVGNHGWTSTIGFPARHSRAIAVGACGPADQVTQYSNVGAEIDVVAPSSHGNVGKVYSTDVSQPGWGFNRGQRGDPDGWFSNAFGKTSAAAATTAGVAALCLSANPNLTAAEVRTVLQVTADKVGGYQVVYDAQGHSREFGHGCINAAEAVALATQMLGPLAPQSAQGSTPA